MGHTRQTLIIGRAANSTCNKESSTLTCTGVKCHGTKTRHNPQNYRLYCACLSGANAEMYTHRDNINSGPMAWEVKQRKGCWVARFKISVSLPSAVLCFFLCVLNKLKLCCLPRIPCLKWHYPLFFLVGFDQTLMAPCTHLSCSSTHC